jgi:hypothetical protein
LDQPALVALELLYHCYLHPFEVVPVELVLVELVLVELLLVALAVVVEAVALGLTLSLYGQGFR